MTLLPNYLQQQASLYRLQKARNKQAVTPLTPPPVNPITLTDFKRRMFRRYQHAPHLQVFDEHLMQVARYVETGGKEGIGFLISEMPPRHGKSFTLSRFFPAWFVGRNPDFRVMNVSYGATLAEKSSRLARNLIASPDYQAMFPATQLDPQSRAVDAWNLLGREGGMDAMGVLGGATGKGAHILNCDDLIKGHDEANSQVIRDKTWSAFTDDLMSRLEPGGAVILNATRWHLDDPIGRAMLHFKDIYGDKFAHLHFPAIATEPDILGRQPGDALWSERYPIEILRRTEALHMKDGSRAAWESLYQQNPIPPEGGMFKRAWFTRHMTSPPIVSAVRYWDLAMSEKTTADFTAGVKIGIAEDGHRYVLDVFHERVDMGDLTERLAQVMILDGSNVAQYIEKKGYMSRAIEALNVDTRLHGYQVWGVDVDKDKVTRAYPAASKASSGVVHLLERHWTDEFLDELCSFPFSAHDDMVDAFSGAETALGSAMMEALGGMNVNTSSPISASDY